MVGREDRGVTEREHVLDHGLIRLCRDRAKTPRLQAAAQPRAQPLGSIEPLAQQIALSPGLRQFGIETPSPGHPGHDVTEKESEPAHSGGKPTSGRHLKVGLYGHNSRAVPISREGCIATLWHL